MRRNDKRPCRVYTVLDASGTHTRTSVTHFWSQDARHGRQHDLLRLAARGASRALRHFCLLCNPRASDSAAVLPVCVTHCAEADVVVVARRWLLTSRGNTSDHKFSLYGLLRLLIKLTRIMRPHHSQVRERCYSDEAAWKTAQRSMRSSTVGF